LKVQEVFWGPEAEFLPIWVEGVEFEGCISYNRSRRFNQVSEIHAGTELVIMCQKETDSSCWEAPSWFVYIVNNVGDYGIQQSDLHEIRMLVKEHRRKEKAGK